MMKRGGSIRLVGAILVTVALLLLLPCMGTTGSLEPTSDAVDTSGNPLPTMRTLNEIPPTWSKKLPCDSTTNCPRFEVLADFNNEAVLDKETGLVWQRTADNYTTDWSGAQIRCNFLYLGGRQGWRLPTVQELAGLFDWSRELYAGLPNGHPFIVQPQDGHWWSATTLEYDPYWAYCVWVHGGAVTTVQKPHTDVHVWCVRGGLGVSYE